MISLAVSFAVLIIGWLLYGRLAEKVFAPDDRQTPAVRINDGVDCMPLKTPKAFLVQLLNIAGTGPIFGALMGAQFGPCVFLWIVFGSVLGGAVHDYMTGMISCRHDGQSVAELSGIYFGRVGKWIMRVFFDRYSDPCRNGVHHKSRRASRKADSGCAEYEFLDSCNNRLLCACNALAHR